MKKNHDKFFGFFLFYSKKWKNKKFIYFALFIFSGNKKTAAIGFEPPTIRHPLP